MMDTNNNANSKIEQLKSKKESSTGGGGCCFKKRHELEQIRTVIQFVLDVVFATILFVIKTPISVIIGVFSLVFGLVAVSFFILGDANRLRRFIVVYMICAVIVIGLKLIALVCCAISAVKPNSTFFRPHDRDLNNIFYWSFLGGIAISVAIRIPFLLATAYQWGFFCCKRQQIGTEDEKQITPKIVIT